MSELEIIRDSVREFVESKIAPSAPIIDRDDEYPREVIRELGRHGYLVPNDVYDLRTLYEVEKEVAKVSGSVALLIDVQAALFYAPVKKHSSFDLSKIVSGDEIGAFALSEPGGGSDATNLKTKAEEKDGGYVINGKKMWITQGMYADLYLVSARTGGPGAKGISAFLVKYDECIKRRKIEVMGCRGTGTAELTFENCWVPKESRIGGWEVPRYGLKIGRLAIAGIAVGLALGSLKEAQDWMKSRTAFSKTLSEMQGLQWYIADSITEVKAADSLAVEASQKFDEEEGDVVVPMAKIFSALVANRVIDRAVQILGGIGYAKGSLSERAYRDARLLRIGEGTDEVERNLIWSRINQVKL
ncbi:acyl-CoA dehydrogenase [Sulfolobales archaeon HS-7]|nr:acyl-CoA dehydrogenase [Sulfolobales archaeon HS-7]